MIRRSGYRIWYRMYRIRKYCIALYRSCIAAVSQPYRIADAIQMRYNSETDFPEVHADKPCPCFVYSKTPIAKVSVFTKGVARWSGVFIQRKTPKHPERENTGGSLKIIHNTCSWLSTGNLPAQAVSIARGDLFKHNNGSPRTTIYRYLCPLLTPHGKAEKQY